MSTEPGEAPEHWLINDWLEALEVAAGQRIDPTYDPLEPHHVEAFQTTVLRMLREQVQDVVKLLNPTVGAVTELQGHVKEHEDLLLRMLAALDAHGPAGLAAEVDAWLRSRDGDA